MRIKLLLILSLTLSFCGSEISVHDGYDFNKPAEKTDLPPELLEISGISYVGDNVLVAVMDEDAIIYFLDLKTLKIKNKVRFGQRGDYEDIVYAGSNIYVLKSNGNIFKIPNTGKDEEGIEIVTGLSAKYDAEGLCLDKASNRLLLACKGNAGKSADNEKLIFAFDLSSETLNNTPLLSFGMKDLESFIHEHKRELQNSVRGLGKEKKINQVFTPSAIAIHPLSGELYVLSSRNNILLVSDLKGKILNMVSLGYELFTQPEGITFDQDGKLYISNEGKKTPANIIGYTYRSE